MDQNFLDTERTPRELILFGAAAGGLLFSVIGMILSSVPIALAGLALAGLGFAGFALQKS